MGCYGFFSLQSYVYTPRFWRTSPEFRNLVNQAILCDVAVERQVEIMGPDAAKFTQFLICRDLRTCEIGQYKYVLITDQDGGIINDPKLLKLAEGRFWLSIADSDVLLWAKWGAATVGMDVKISEPDVSPIQLQGPLSREILRAAFSDETAALKYYRFINYDWNGVPLKISRTGWSSELGYEIFLCDGSKGDLLWEYLMKVGKPMGLHPGYTSSIRRIEGAMLSCQADMTLVNNPFEMGMDRFVDLDTNADFLSKTALRKIKSRGPKQVHVGFEFDGPPLIGSNDHRWPITSEGSQIGEITSAVYSPRLEKNIALDFIQPQHSSIGTEADIDSRNFFAKCRVVPKPFYDPNKKILLSGNPNYWFGLALLRP